MVHLDETIIFSFTAIMNKLVFFTESSFAFLNLLFYFVLVLPYVLMLVHLTTQAGSQDTLNSIALKFNITPNKLVELNKLFTHTIVPGQVIIFVLNIILEILPSFFFAVSNDLVRMS